MPLADPGRKRDSTTTTTTNNDHRDLGPARPPPRPL